MIKETLKKIIPFHWRYYMRQILFPSTVNENIPLRKEFYSYFLKEGDWVFDVGANMGNRVKAFLECKAKVLAIEPQKSCYKYLKLMFGNKIQLVTKGLGAIEGIKKFYIADSSTISTFSEDYIKAVKESGRFGNNNWNRTEEIEMTTLDNLIQLYGIPAFIKIDVEGFEQRILSQNLEWLDQVKNIILETHSGEANKVCTKTLLSKGFQIKKLNTLTGDTENIYWASRL